MRFKDRVAVITGGGRGIGAACARRFAEDGAAVVIADVDDAPDFGAHPGGSGRIFMEEHDDLAALDVSGIKEHTPACDATWGAVYALMVPGTYETAVWRDL